MGNIVRTAVAAGIVLVACSKKTPERSMKPAELAAIAAAACADDCAAGEVLNAKLGPPVFVFEERHDSRIGQLQLALAMNRLYHGQKLRDIGLEGLLFDSGGIDASWARSLQRGDQAAFERSLVQLLQDGEMSAVEFMALLHSDVSVHPLESPSDYVSAPEVDAYGRLLYEIAARSLTMEQMQRLQEYNERLRTLTGAEREKVAETAREMIESADPWVKGVIAKLEGDHPTLEEQMQLYDEVVKRAESLSIEIDSGQKAAIAAYREFLVARERASTTMAEAASRMAKESKQRLVAMVIGAAHTATVLTQLNLGKRQAIALSPLALKNKDDTGSLTNEQFERKSKRKSVNKDDVASWLLDESLIKPKPVTSEKWFQAKTELYLLPDRIVEAALGGGRGGGGVPPVGRPPPPFGLPPDAFDGKWIHIDPKSIEVLTEDGREVVVFKAIVGVSPTEGKEVWIKGAKKKSEKVPAAERERVEQMLKEAIATVRAEAKVVAKDAASAGRIQVTRDTVLAFAKTREDVIAISLPSI